MENEQLLLEKEKKTQVEEKKYAVDDWTVELTSKLVDARTLTEQYNNVPPKNNIVNSVLLSKNIHGNELKTAKETPYYPSFEVQKTIKHGSNEPVFTIKIDILTFSDIRLLKTKPLQIQFSPDKVVDFKNDAIVIFYKENEELKAAGVSNFQNIICELVVSLKTINKLRISQNNVIMSINTSDDVFYIILPKIFIEYLNEI